MLTPETLNLIGRICVAFYFIWSVWFNFNAREFHLSEFKRIGVSSGAVLLPVGLCMALAGGLLLLYTPTVIYGAGLLIAFTVTADALFHRFWTYSDPHEATIHKFFLYEHVALVGGIIGLAGPHF